MQPANHTGLHAQPYLTYVFAHYQPLWLVYYIAVIEPV